jgi:hypothetical protein
MADNSKRGNFIHFLPGGGLGDVFREAYFMNGLGILKRWKSEHPADRLRVLLMTHNPASADLLSGQSWIDELVVRPFPVAKTWEWQAVYDLYPDDFAGHTELRISLYDYRTLYDSNKNKLRKKLTDVRQIETIGTAWALELSADEWKRVFDLAGRVVYHPHAGSADRALSTYPEIDDAVRGALLRSGVDVITVGANYERPAYKQIPAHGREDGLDLSPRVLAEVLRRAPAVVGTESSVYYIASMLGTPTLLMHPTGTAFDRMLKGDHTWSWFFDLQNPDSRHVHFSVVQERADKIAAWALQRQQSALGSVGARGQPA